MPTSDTGRTRSTPPLWLRGLVFVYLGLLIAGPVTLVVLNAFSDGIGTFWTAITRPDALHALGLTLLIALVVVPANTVFGVLCALLLARSNSPARRVVSAVVNLPFALSPVVMIGGWLAAETLQPPSYRRVRSTISGLAGLGGTGRWIMTSALFVVGAGYFATAAGLPGVQVPAGSC